MLPIWRLHAHRRLVEPFCGGLAVALGLGPTNALLNDANPHLINFYRWLQRGLRTQIPMENEERLFYRNRDRFNEILRTEEAASAEAAALFYYLNRTGFNGLCRFNRQGAFNVPFGRYKRIAYTRDFSLYQQAFAGWEFTSGDIEEVCLEKGDFVYADPPYDVEFTHYAKGGFSWPDQERTDLTVLRGRVAESEGRKSLIVGTIALASAPDDALVEARGLFVTPRQEKLEAYFGGITDAAGEHRTPDRPGDAVGVPEE